MICTAILQESWARAAVKELSRRWDFWLTINTFLPRLSRDPALQPVLLNFILPRVGGNRPGERAAVALIEHMIDMLPDPPASVRPVAHLVGEVIIGLTDQYGNSMKIHHAVMRMVGVLNRLEPGNPCDSEGESDFEFSLDDLFWTVGEILMRSAPATPPRRARGRQDRNTLSVASTIDWGR